MYTSRPSDSQSCHSGSQQNLLYAHGVLVKPGLSWKLWQLSLNLYGYLHVKYNDIPSDTFQDIPVLPGLPSLTYLVVQAVFLWKCPASVPRGGDPDMGWRTAGRWIRLYLVVRRDTCAAGVCCRNPGMKAVPGCCK